MTAQPTVQEMKEELVQLENKLNSPIKNSERNRAQLRVKTLKSILR